MTDPIPYNLTIPSQDASLSYFPLRGSSNTTGDGWVLAYSAGLLPGNYSGRQGKGADYHTTTRAGSFVQINWIGTGIYFYGNATSGAYKIAVDGNNVAVAGLNASNGGLLGSKVGLRYSQHSATLSVVQNQKVAFQYAQVTIGYGYPGNSIQNRTVQAVDDDGPTRKPNSEFFNFVGSDSGGWAVEEQQRMITYPNGTEEQITHQMKTNLKADSLKFKVNNSSAFVLWGSMFNDHFPKRATLTPGPRGGPTKTTDIYDICNTLDFQQVFYWESGLDYDTTYEVEISNIDSDRNSFLAFNKLELLDGGPAPPQPSSFQSKYIAAIVIPIVALITALIAGVLFWRRRRRRQNLMKYDGVLESPADGSEHSIEPFPPPDPAVKRNNNNLRELDAGPLSTLPPEYDNSWAGGTESHREGTQPESSESSGTTMPNTASSSRRSPLPPIPAKRYG
ncbi:hypothetical protein E1B28_002203 [Marasmius oreades]|uniref:Uncharacterized protein n=1 Tax=Marasmius oreades TaxID=181124 RepID=A0A9P7RMJ7_9AGAR|nr:uncharacterized protein E1B28_002203 [Marasmius oreades]KAG7086232.1 hypothetical protein E1B28_002203 [Marasmius oreades]